MEYEFEKRFVKSFIRKSRQERLLYELTKPDKRYDGLSRFCHQTDSFIDNSKLLMSGTNLRNSAEFIDFIKKHNITCHIMSPDYAYDNLDLPLTEALSELFYCLDSSIILGDVFTIITTEAEKKGQIQYVLTNDKK